MDPVEIVFAMSIATLLTMFIGTMIVTYIKDTKLNAKAKQNKIDFDEEKAKHLHLMKTLGYDKCEEETQKWVLKYYPGFVFSHKDV